MIILGDNQTLEAASITANDEHFSFPFSAALTDSRLSRVGKTNDVTGTKTIIITFAEEITADYISILNHNFSAAAVVTIDNGITTKTLTIADSIVQKIDLVGDTFTLNITDAANPDGYLKIGLVYLGSYTDMGGISQGAGINHNSDSTQVFSGSGQLTGGKRLNYKTASFTFSDISETQRQTNTQLFNNLDIITPFILLIWENSLTVEPPLYCCFLKPFQYKKSALDGVLWSTTMEIREVF